MCTWNEKLKPVYMLKIIIFNLLLFIFNQNKLYKDVSLYVSKIY